MFFKAQKCCKCDLKNYFFAFSSLNLYNNIFAPCIIAIFNYTFTNTGKLVIKGFHFDKKIRLI